MPRLMSLLQAFAEHFTEIQLTNLVLMALDDLTDSKYKVSLAAAQLMSAVMKERGRDMLKVVWGCGRVLKTGTLASFLTLILTS